MNVKYIKLTAKILITVLLVLSLILSSVSLFLNLAFSVQGIENRLDKNGFYELGYKSFTDNIAEIRNVVNIDTDLLISAVSESEVKALLTDYTHSLNLHLIDGVQDGYTPQYSSSALRDLVEKNIGEESYGEHFELVELDREYAYNDIVLTVNGTVSFFPMSLYEKALSFVGKFLPVAKIYPFVYILKKCLLPSVAVAILCIAGLILLQRKKKTDVLRYISSVLFFFSSVLFFGVLFLNRGGYINRLSVADGLLREYIKTVYYHFGACIFLPSMILFIVSAVFMLTMLIISSITKRTQ